MTYARARLWLGISGVGSLVVLAVIGLLYQVPQSMLSNASSFGSKEIAQLATVASIWILWMIPLDLLGGFVLPRRYGKSNQTFVNWFASYFKAALFQFGVFLLFGSLIIFTGQRFGNLGVLLVICLGIAISFAVRDRWLLRRRIKSEEVSDKLFEAITVIQSWRIFAPRTVVVDHQDPGFTGGIVGVGHRSQIVIPKGWLSFSREQLATAIARRAVAINSGSYTRGLIAACIWNTLGFLLCSVVPGAGFGSVAALTTTVLAFTVWTFGGLLVLPTLSRRSSLRIDQELLNKGMPAGLIMSTANSMDQLQDGEPDRPTLIETIFHPVPKVSSRNPETPVRGVALWNVARTTLFLSWPCLGLLARSVHCNVGRPELWTMLPTD